MDKKKNALQNVRKDSGDVNSGSVLLETLRQKKVQQQPRPAA